MPLDIAIMNNVLLYFVVCFFSFLLPSKFEKNKQFALVNLKPKSKFHLVLKVLKLAQQCIEVYSIDPSDFHAVSPKYLRFFSEKCCFVFQYYHYFRSFILNFEGCIIKMAKWFKGELSQKLKRQDINNYPAKSNIYCTNHNLIIMYKLNLSYILADDMSYLRMNIRQQGSGRIWSWLF
jgi:hypothetical protein